MAKFIFAVPARALSWRRHYGALVVTPRWRTGRAWLPLPEQALIALTLGGENVPLLAPVAVLFRCVAASLPIASRSDMWRCGNAAALEDTA